MADRKRADAWTELLFQFALPFVQEAGEQLRNHHGATPRIVSSHAFMHSPLGTGVYVVLKMPLSISFPSGEADLLFA